MSLGTFNVSRKIWEHDAFQHEPFSEREAFLWLVSEAAWKPRTKRVGKYTADLDRGQVFASVRFMAEAWQWSKSRVSRFLLRLKNRDMLRTESGTVVLTITICNYNEYQPKATTSGTVAGQLAGQKRDSSGTNYKKDNTLKKKEESYDSRAFGEFWAVYPKRLGKKSASEKFKTAVRSGVSSQHLINGAKRYAAWCLENRKEERFIKNPATWFNQGCWDDELKPEKGKADERFARKMEMATSFDGGSPTDSGLDHGSGGGDSLTVLPPRSIGGG